MTTLDDQFTLMHLSLNDDKNDVDPVLVTHKSLDRLRGLVTELTAAHPFSEVCIFARWDTPCHLQWMDMNVGRGMVAEISETEVEVISTPLTSRSKAETRVFRLDNPTERGELIPYMQKRWLSLSKEPTEAARHALEQALDEVGESLVKATSERLHFAIDDVVASTHIDRELEHLVLREIARSNGDVPPSVHDDVIFVARCLGAVEDQQVWLADLGSLEAHDMSRPDWFISALPTEVARRMLQSRRGRAAALGLLCGITRGAPHERLATLASYWRKGSYAELCLSASGQDSKVSFDAVPQSDRLDLKAQGNRYRAALASFDALLTDLKLH